jgi:ribosomal protein L11 methylase PrmA
VEVKELVSKMIRKFRENAPQIISGILMDEQGQVTARISSPQRSNDCHHQYTFFSDV